VSEQVVGTSSVAEALELVNGVAPEEFDRVVALFGRLDDRLRSFATGTVQLHLSIKQRDLPGQRATLEASIEGQHRIAATSDRPDFEAAIAEVRDDLIRQITDSKNRTEPRNSRARRETL
jgi:ribosome-associated translation inhibitor RaiA